jgi:hypothetical protein
MKMNQVTAFCLLMIATAGFALAGSRTQARATNTDLSHFTDYGFKSASEMERYFTVTKMNVEEVPVVVTDDLRNKLQQLTANDLIIDLPPDFPLGTKNPPFVNPPVGATPRPTVTAPCTTGTVLVPGPTPTQSTVLIPDAPTGIVPPVAVPCNNQVGPTPFPQIGTYPGIGGIGSLGTGALGTIGGYILLGEQLWQIVMDNKPVANVATNRVSVLPVAQQDWAQMENWQPPMLHAYKLSALNWFGKIAAAQTYTVSYNYGGQWNGVGHYLANATIIPTEIIVGWGYTLNTTVEVGTVINMATKADPIPGVDLQLRWIVESKIKHQEGRESFFVQGDGQSKHFDGSAPVLNPTSPAPNK